MNDLYTEMVNIAKIRDGLFIGDFIAGTTIDLIYEFKISHMINTASTQIPSQFMSIGVKYLNLNWPENPLLDKQIIKDDIVTKIINFIDLCLKNGDGLLIYSVKGQNRCCVAIVIYLMKKYSWSVEKCKQYLLCKKQDIKISKNFMEQLLNYEAHLYKLYPNRKKSVNWNIDSNIKDNDELLMTNTYLNEIELKKKKNIFSDNKIKKKDRHVGWADDINNLNSENKLVNYNIENDLYFKRNVKDITSHLNYSNNLKSIIIKETKKEDEKINNFNNNDNEVKNDSSLDENNKEEKMEFFNAKNLLKDEKENKEEDIKQENKNEKKDEIKNEMENKDILIKKINYDQEKENNINIGNNIIEIKDPFNEIKLKEDNNHKNNKMKLNIFKNLNEKEQINCLNNNNEKFPINIPIKDFNKFGHEKGMNINFNNINMVDLHKKYYNNFISNDNKKNVKSNNNAYSIYLKNQNKGQKKSRSTSKTNHNNNLIPFIEYNQNNNIITNIMIQNPQFLNNNQKLFVKFNKDNNNNIINNNNQFIQNNNFININYYPQANESKYNLI